MAKVLSFLFKKKTQEEPFRWSSDDEEPSSSAPSLLDMAGSSVKEDLTLEIMEPSVKEDPSTDIKEPSVEDPSIDSKEPSIRMEHQMKLGLATIFSYEELKEATRSFDSSQVIGEGGFGRVYLGKLKGQTVAVKKLKDDNKDILEQFFNEVTVLSRIRHKNLVTLHGCTNPRSQELLLVYEFVPNGTVAEHLHGERPTLTWPARIQIAIETAEALTYLHALKPPIIHRDVKTSNILLDNAFHVKVSDLGICRHFAWDMTHVSTMPQGTMGYRDPEYERFFRLTDKSDVYSFGVVLLELISGMKAVDVYRDPNNIYLDVMALNKIKINKMSELFDQKLDYHSDDGVTRMINSVAELARRCLWQEAIRRPTMVQVLKALKDINHWPHKIRDKDEELHKVDGFREQAYVFPYEELHKAMKSFRLWILRDEIVYHGKFHGRMVAVKFHYKKFRDEVFDEVKFISQFRHDNIATVYGSTDTRKISWTNGGSEILVVHEYAAKGTLGYHLHGPRVYGFDKLSSGLGKYYEFMFQSKQQRIALSWAVRIRIAVETAEALLYLHSLKPPFVHKNLTTYNILLDGHCHVKLTGFSLSIKYPNDDPTFSEGDPIHTTYDVYSFGLVLLQLISGKDLLSTYLPDMRIWDRLHLRDMIKWAPKLIRKNELDQFVDTKLNYHSNLDTQRMVQSVAELACKCLLPEGDERPKMVEVLSELKVINTTVN